MRHVSFIMNSMVTMVQLQNFGLFPNEDEVSIYFSDWNAFQGFFPQGAIFGPIFPVGRGPTGSLTRGVFT